MALFSAHRKLFVGGLSYETKKGKLNSFHETNGLSTGFKSVSWSQVRFEILVTFSFHRGTSRIFCQIWRSRWCWNKNGCADRPFKVVISFFTAFVYNVCHEGFIMKKYAPDRILSHVFEDDFESLYFKLLFSKRRQTMPCVYLVFMCDCYGNYLAPVVNGAIFREHL